MLRERVIDIERVIWSWGQDLSYVKARGVADDILLQTCRKLCTRAKESIWREGLSEFTIRRLDMTRNAS